MGQNTPTETMARQRMLLTKTTVAVHVTQSRKEMGFGWAIAANQSILLAIGSGTMPKGIERTTPRQSGLAGIYAGIHTARSIANAEWTVYDPELAIVCSHKGTAEYIALICQRTYKQRAPTCTHQQNVSCRHSNEDESQSSTSRSAKTQNQYEQWLKQ